MSHDYIKQPCPECGKRLKLLTHQKRKKVVCPQCGHVFRMTNPLDLAAPQKRKGGRSTELSRAEVMQLEQVASEDQDAPVAAEKVLPESMEQGLAVETQEKAAHWVAQREQAQALKLLRHRRVGMVLVVVAVIAIVLQFSGYRFVFLDGMVSENNVGGGVFYFVLLGIIGGVLLAFALRQAVSRATVLAAAIACLLVLGGVGSFLSARWAETKKSEMISAKEMNTTDQEGRGGSSNKFRKDQLIRLEPRRTRAASANRVATHRSSPTARDAVEYPLPPSTVSSNELNPIPIESNDSKETFRPADQKAGISVETISKEVKENPFQVIDSIGDRAAGGADPPFEDYDLPRPELVRDLKNQNKKRSAMKASANAMRPVRCIGGNISEKERLSQFQLTSAAGRETKFGKIYFRDQPCIGLDTLGAQPPSEAVFDLVLPIHGLPEFPSSLRHKKGFCLAGIKVNVQQDEIVGVQALLAPIKDGRLDMTKAVPSRWAGQETAPEQDQVIVSAGQAVFGLVVYEEKLKIKGIGLVLRK